MPTGRSMQLARQIGENLIVAELGRREYIATTFAGNVPEIDILAQSPSGTTFGIQVKAIRGISWQFDVRTFLHVELVENMQKIRGKTSALPRELFCVFVKIGDYGNDEFYIFQLGFLQDFFHESYRGGLRPRNPTSFHCAIWIKDIVSHRDRWDILPV